MSNKFFINVLFYDYLKLTNLWLENGYGNSWCPYWITKSAVKKTLITLKLSRNYLKLKSILWRSRAEPSWKFFSSSSGSSQLGLNSSLVIMQNQPFSIGILANSKIKFWHFMWNRPWNQSASSESALSAI